MVNEKVKKYTSTLYKIERPISYRRILGPKSFNFFNLVSCLFNKK
ncbi:hypothetical protein D927_01253 [Enterococcus faecalis 02-MB-BW-10]|nr:hypothetical protein D927_01253 [Enterococcus faecalis 02-MB-BW-10]